MAQSKQFSNRGMNVSKSEMTYTLYLVGIPRDQNVELNLYNHFCQFGTKNRLSWDTMVTHQQLPWHLLKVKLQKRQMIVLSSYWTIRTFKWHWFLRMPLHQRNQYAFFVTQNWLANGVLRIMSKGFMVKYDTNVRLAKLHLLLKICLSTNIHSTGSNAIANKRISDRIEDTVLPREQMRSLQRQIEMNEGKYFKALTMVDTNKKAIERQLERKCLLHSISLFQVILNFIFAYKISRERCASEE